MKKHNPFLLFDIETGGLESDNSILSISYKRLGKKTKSLYAAPAPGSTLSKWASENVWKPIQQHLGFSPRKTEEQALKQFLGVLKAHRGGTVAGWNIGYVPTPFNQKTSKGFDVGKVIQRADLYGDLGQQYRTAFGGVNLRDIGREYSVRIAEQMTKHPDIMDPKLFKSAESFTKLVNTNKNLHRLYTVPEQAAWMGTPGRYGGYEVAGWRQKSVFKYLFGKEPDRQHLGHFDIEALSDIVTKGDPGKLQGPEFARILNAEALSEKALASARARSGGKGLGGILRAGASAFDGMGIRAGIRNNKVPLAIAGAALGLFATKPLSWFSGKDDNWNTIEGLPHGGVAEKKRRQMTDFGSGYQGDKTYERKVKERFGFFKRALNKHGKEVGTGHKRILIPKKALSASQLEEVMGFVPVTVAIPEAGQKTFASYRHPEMLYHIHDHGEQWSMHADRHAASTMLIKKWMMERTGRIRSNLSDMKAKTEESILTPIQHFFAGIPHVLEEGIPGAYYYLKGQLLGGETMLDRLRQDLSPEYQKRVSQFKEIKHDSWSGLRRVGRAIRNKFSGRDDAYNVLEGLRHGGQAERKRLELTDFGSGYRGIIRMNADLKGLFGIGKTTGGTQYSVDLMLAATNKFIKARPWKERLFGTHYSTAKVLQTLRTDIKAVKKAGHEHFIGIWSDYLYENKSKMKGLNDVKALIRHERVHMGARVLYGEGDLPGKSPAAWTTYLSDRGAYRDSPEQHFEELAAFSYQEKYQKGLVFPAGTISDKSAQIGAYLADIGQERRLANIAKFSGRDDAYNTIEGLKHGGLAASIRNLLTDFGSGWRGLFGLSKGFSVANIKALAGKAKSMSAGEFMSHLGVQVTDSPWLMQNFGGAANLMSEKSFHRIMKGTPKGAYTKDAIATGLAPGTAFVHKDLSIWVRNLYKKESTNFMTGVRSSFKGEERSELIRHLKGDRATAKDLGNQIKMIRRGQRAMNKLSDDDIVKVTAFHEATELKNAERLTSNKSVAEQWQLFGGQAPHQATLPQEELFLRHFKPEAREAFAGLRKLSDNWFSGFDDQYNTIEGLRHGGIAEPLRKALTDFGSGWQGIRAALRAAQKGKTPNQIKKAFEKAAKAAAGRIGKVGPTGIPLGGTGVQKMKMHDVGGEKWLAVRHLGEGGLGTADIAIGTKSARMGVLKTSTKDVEFTRGGGLAGGPLVKKIFNPETDIMQKMPALKFVQQYMDAIVTTGGQHNLKPGSFAYEIKMQEMAREQYGNMVPEIFAKGEKQFVSEYAGRTLSSLYKAGQLSATQATESFSWMKETFSEMYAGKGMAHFDPSAANITLRGGRPMVIDWGLSAPMSDFTNHEFAMTGHKLASELETRYLKELSPSPPIPASIDKQAMAAKQQEAVRIAASNAKNGGKGHMKMGPDRTRTVTVPFRSK